MVSNDVVMQTVKRMISSGVDDNTVRVTLRGIGLSDPEIDNIMAEAKGITPKEEKTIRKSPQESIPEYHESKEADSEENADEDLDEDDSESDEEYAEDLEETPEAMRKRLDQVSQEQSAQHTTTHNILDEHADKLGDVHQSINDLHDKFDSSPKLSSESIAKLNALDKRISGLEKEVAETKANTIALQELLKKILEANRKMISLLEKKK